MAAGQREERAHGVLAGRADVEQARLEGEAPRKGPSSNSGVAV